MDLGINGKVAAVAASSAGLGRAIAELLAEEGAKVAVCSRSEERISRTASEIARKTGADILPITADVSRQEDAIRFVRTPIERWGDIDILVTNAGGPPPGSFENLEDADWQNAFELNLMSTIRMIRETVPNMRRNRWGRIINMTSTSVKAPIDNLLLSNSIRTAVVGMAKTLSREVAGDNITVNNICPGRIDTDRIRSLDSNRAERSGKPVEDVRREQEAQIPAGRYGSAREVASLVAFLASEPASYITGTTIQVDGGMLNNLL